MNSNIEKKLIGSYRPSRDGPLETESLPQTGVVTSFEPPKGLSATNKKLWGELVGSLCAMGVVYVSDYTSLSKAFYLLDELDKIKKNKKDVPVTSDTFDKLTRLELKLIGQFQSIMTSFLVTPKERLKALRLLPRDSQQKKKDAIDEFLND